MWEKTWKMLPWQWSLWNAPLQVQAKYFFCFGICPKQGWTKHADFAWLFANLLPYASFLQQPLHLWTRQWLRRWTAWQRPTSAPVQPSRGSTIFRQNINFGIVDGHRVDGVVLAGKVGLVQHLRRRHTKDRQSFWRLTQADWVASNRSNSMLMICSCFNVCQGLMNSTIMAKTQTVVVRCLTDN